MSESIYIFLDYRKYLQNYFKNSKTGAKTKAAKFLGVHTSLLPQILNGSCDLSLEQAEKFNRFFGHNEDESFYFILLVLKARSGTSTLSQRLQKQIEDARKKSLEISSRVAKEKNIPDQDQERFYSNYLYAAIHVLSSIPAYSNIQKISEALGKPEHEIARAVDFLLSLEIIQKKNGVLSPGSRHVHISPESPFVVNNHLNWRLKAIEKIRENPRTDLHYSGALSLSEEDVFKIKDILSSAIARSTQIATLSSEETAYVLCADFFSLNYR